MEDERQAVGKAPAGISLGNDIRLKNEGGNSVKKAISVLLAIFMLFALISCAAKEEAAAPSASASAAPPASQAPASEAPDESSAPAVDPSANADEVGFFKSGVDPKSRDTYDIIFAYTRTLLLFEMMTQCFNKYADDLNVTITPSTAEMDMDKMMTSIETFAEQGADGFIIVIDPATKDRTVEVLNETGVPYIALFNSVRDENGNSLVPTVGLDQYATGAMTMQWLIDNYRTYWGDIDTSKLGLVSITFSVSVDLNDRELGAQDVFKKNFPNNSNLIFVADGVTGTGSGEDIGYNLSSAILAANPNVEYWFVTNCLEMYAQGATRAVEQLGMEDRVLITACGSDIACSEWENGYEGSWASAIAISNYLYAAPALCGLVSLIDGVSTPESLWPDMKAPGDTAAFYRADVEMITKDTYKTYFNRIAEMAGMELPYKD
jgi:ABC-type sugar transport system substrate-binding protein